MKRFLLSISLLGAICTFAAEWSFSGGFVYFDNSKTCWDKNIYLIIGKSTYSSVYQMTLNPENPSQYVASLPANGWEDAEYMAVVCSSDWKKGNFGYDALKAASGYTAAYTAGLKATTNQRFLLTPDSKNNGCAINLKWLGDNQPITFTDLEKNNCQKLDAENGVVTLIFSTSSKRQNVNIDDIERIYINGSISAWNGDNAHFVLPVRSSDGCFFGTFSLSDLQRRGNSGQPEFVFRVCKKDGTDYTCRAHSSWEGGIDERLVFINNGENMMILLPGDDIKEIGQRKMFAQYVAPLSDFNLQDSADIAHITNFRRVPGTTQLYRSYHPYKPDRAHYNTERARMRLLDTLGTRYGIQCDIALSGNESGHAGEHYTCGGQDYTITIPAYYQTIIDNNNVLYVGTANGHTPDYQTAVFFTDGVRFGQWMQEVVQFIVSDAHPAPFQIHCSLGADRTGAFCAILAALCGASWETIATDYHETSNLRIQEYRHPNCVRYELQLLTGEDPAIFQPISPSSGLTLAQAVAKHFIDGGYLTQEEIDKVVAKLAKPNYSTALYNASPVSNNRRLYLANGTIYISCNDGIYDLLGRPMAYSCQ